MSVPALMSGQQRYILVVDSDWNERFTLSMLLQRFGYTIANTNMADEGIEFLCVAPATAIFAEGGRVGTELQSLLRADPRFRDIPLVLVSPDSDPAIEAGLEDGSLAAVLRTPVDPDSVYQVIQKVIEKGTRANIRIATALEADVKDGYGTTQGYVTVLSQYGLFFRTLEPRPVKSRISVSISFGDRIVKLGAEVLDLVSFEQGPFAEPGMAMKFVDISLEDRALIRFYIYEQVGGGLVHPEPGWGRGSA